MYSSWVSAPAMQPTYCGDVGAGGVVHAGVGDDVGDGEAAAGLEHARGLAQDLRLVGGEVDDAVGEHDVDRVGGQRDRFDVALEPVDVRRCRPWPGWRGRGRASRRSCRGRRRCRSGRRGGRRAGRRCRRRSRGRARPRRAAGRPSRSGCRSRARRSARARAARRARRRRRGRAPKSSACSSVMIAASGLQHPAAAVGSGWRARPRRSARGRSRAARRRACGAAAGSARGARLAARGLVGRLAAGVLGGGGAAGAGGGGAGGEVGQLSHAVSSSSASGRT